MSEEILTRLAARFREKTAGIVGSTVKLNDTFYSYNVVSRAIFRLRMECCQGRNLNQSGQSYLAEVAAFLAEIMLRNWRKRGFRVSIDAEWNPGSEKNRICLSASRDRDGNTEIYTHDFWKDMSGFVLRPAQRFAYSGPFLYAFESLVLPSPESLYMTGVQLMQSPYATGNWPKGPTPGGIAEDYELARQQLIDDLHIDCGLPLDHRGMRQLSYWTVFPTYGWTQNDCGEYNLMTLFSQISENQVLSKSDAFEYLRGLLRSQCLAMRNLGARCLMAYNQAPASVPEARAYNQAMVWRDAPRLQNYLLRSRAKIEGNEELAGNQSWVNQVIAQYKSWGQASYLKDNPEDPLTKDPRYAELSQLAADKISEAISALSALSKAYPQSWTAKMLHATVQLNGPKPEQAEKLVRQVMKLKCPNPEAHLRLGTHLKKSGRRDEALQVFKEALKHWPYNYQVVDSCFWMLTDSMIEY